MNNVRNIYITGDTHGTYDITKLYMFCKEQEKKGNSLIKNDIVIIAGDVAFFWGDNRIHEQQMFEIYKNFPFTTLFIDGNHDDHNRILTLPTEHMFGSDVGEVIKDKMYHLRRGRIYNIKGYKFLTIGGGLSVDKQYRIENKSWWSGELLNEEDKSKIKKIIEDNNYYTDYIITHVPPQTIINKMEANCLLYNNYNLKEKDPTSIFLENIFALMTFKKWYCGHMHIDYSFFNNSVKCLYNNVVKLPI